MEKRRPASELSDRPSSVTIRKLMWVDTETTGLDFNLHELRQLAGKYIEFPIEMGLLEGLTNPTISRPFNFYIRPDHPERMSAELIEMFKIDVEAFNKPPYLSQLDAFKKFFSAVESKVDKFDPQDKIFFAGHNVAEFDYRFIRNWWERSATALGMDKCWFGSYFHWSCLDTKLLISLYALNAHKLMPKKSHLTNLAEHFNVNLINAHEADSDIDATERVMVAMLKEMEDS